MKFDPSPQAIVLVALAITCVALSSVPMFATVSQWLQNVGSILIGGAFIPRSTDVPLSSVKQIVESLYPPASPPSQ
jgi:hypothetical protein